MVAENKIRVGVIGLGNMGTLHMQDIDALESMILSAVCDIDAEKVALLTERAPLQGFVNYRNMLQKNTVDAVIIATPHYDHIPISIAALQRGIHVLVEKPIGVHAKGIRQMLTAYADAKKEFPDLVFAAMFQQRTYGYWKKIKEVLETRQVGRLIRATWIITDWYRTQSYYDSGGWRATWSGEGGGVLLNQCPHNLDLYQWFFGMPDKVTGFASMGKYHDIEVEDEVSAFFEHGNGMVGHFITSTAESPGTNRLEIVGEYGKIVFEDGELIFTRNLSSLFEHIESSISGFEKVKNQVEHIKYEHHGELGHRFILENFAYAISQEEELLVPAEEGLYSVLLSNAILLSTIWEKTISFPFDEVAYEMELGKLIANSVLRPQQDNLDMRKSF
jgi:predicted dehydrogenase